MNVPTVSMSRGEAAEAFRQYRRAIRKRMLEEDRAILAAYEALAAGQRVIDLVAAFQTTGVGPDGLPKLAICRADAKWCTVYTPGGATAEFTADIKNGRKNISLRLPPDTFDRTLLTAFKRARAMVPIIPPMYRPAASTLAEYYILWEANWQRVPPDDPMLLRPLHGMLYAVVATWDLTPVERMVLGAVRNGPRDVA